MDALAVRASIGSEFVGDAWIELRLRFNPLLAQSPGGRLLDVDLLDFRPAHD